MLQIDFHGNIRAQRAYNLSGGEITMSSRWRSPRKNQGIRPNRYGKEDEDGERDTPDRTLAKPPSKSTFHPIGKKRTARKQVQPRLRNHSSDSSSESSAYKKDLVEGVQFDGIGVARLT